jgi:hypothetical protein
MKISRGIRRSEKWNSVPDYKTSYKEDLVITWAGGDFERVEIDN